MSDKRKWNALDRHRWSLLRDRIRAHRSAPDVYDPPSFEDMARRIEELEAENEFLQQKRGKNLDELERGIIALSVATMRSLERMGDE